MFNFSDTSRLNMNKTYINYRNPKTNEFKIIFGNGKPVTYDEFINSIEKQFYFIKILIYEIVCILSPVIKINTIFYIF